MLLSNSRQKELNLISHRFCPGFKQSMKSLILQRTQMMARLFLLTVKVPQMRSLSLVTSDGYTTVFDQKRDLYDVKGKLSKQ